MCRRFTIYFYIVSNYSTVGRNCEDGIATRYGLDGPGIESQWWGEIFHTLPDRRCCSIAASPVHYTTSCKHSLVLLRMGEIIPRNMLS